MKLLYVAIIFFFFLIIIWIDSIEKESFFPAKHNTSLVHTVYKT